MHFSFLHSDGTAGGFIAFHETGRRLQLNCPFDLAHQAQVALPGSRKILATLREKEQQDSNEFIARKRWPACFDGTPARCPPDVHRNRRSFVQLYSHRRRRQELEIGNELVGGGLLVGGSRLWC